MVKRLIACALSAWLSVASLSATAAPAQNRLGGLSESAQEVAKDIGVLELIGQWRDACDEVQKSSGDVVSLKTLYLRDQLLGVVLNNSLQIRSCISKIDGDLSSTDELRRRVEEETQRKVTLSESANFINSGIAEVISTGVGLSTEALRIPAAAVGSYGGTMEIVLSLLSLKLEHSQRANSHNQPNMLAPLYGLQSDGKTYPKAVWEYLTDSAPNVPTDDSRLEHLKKKWDKLGYTKPNKHERKKMPDRMPFLTSTVEKKRSLSLQLLQDRLSMLQDLRATISVMDQDLSEIVTWTLGELNAEQGFTTPQNKPI